MTTETQSVLEKLRLLLDIADMQLPVCIDDHVCREGDGGGKWFIFDSSFDDGPPIGEFYNTEWDARLVVGVLNILPNLISALEKQAELVRWAEEEVSILRVPARLEREDTQLGNFMPINYARNCLKKVLADMKKLLASLDDTSETSTRLEGKGERDEC